MLYTNTDEYRIAKRTCKETYEFSHSFDAKDQISLVYVCETDIEVVYLVLHCVVCDKNSGVRLLSHRRRRFKVRGGSLTLSAT